MTAEGTFVPDRERDEVSVAIGVVPWKLTWCDQIDSYKSRKRSKDQQERKLNELQDLVIRTEARMEQIIDELMALALSKQSSHHQGPTDKMSSSTKGRSSITSTEHAPTATEAAALVVEAATTPASPKKRKHWPVDHIPMRSACVDGVFWYTKYVHYTLVWI
jgi:hypothetical protein